MGMTDSLNNSDDFCDLITAIYKSSEKFFELYDLEKLNLNELGNLLFEIHKTGERIKYASALYADDSEEISWDEIGPAPERKCHRSFPPGWEASCGRSPRSSAASGL